MLLLLDQKGNAIWKINIHLSHILHHISIGDYFDFDLGFIKWAYFTLGDFLNKVSVCVEHSVEIQFNFRSEFLFLFILNI